LRSGESCVDVAARGADTAERVRLTTIFGLPAGTGLRATHASQRTPLAPGLAVAAAGSAQTTVAGDDEPARLAEMRALS